MSAVVVIAIFVLVITSIPWWRVVADRRFRELFPKQTAVIAAALVGGLVFVIVAAVVVPVVVLIAAALALVVATVASWRSRPQRGRSRAWPPGRISITRSIRSMAHRETHLDSVVRWGPIHKTAQFHRPVVGLVGIRDAREVFREHHAALGASVLPFDERVTGGFLRYMSDADHDRYGSLFRRALSGSALVAVPDATVHALDPVLALVREGTVLSGLGLRTSLAGIAHVVCLETLFGVRPDEDGFRRLSAALSSGVGPPGAPIPNRPDFAAVRSIVTDLSIGGAPSARSAIVEAGHDPDDPVIIDNLIVIQALGTANLAGLFAWVVQYLGVESDAWRAALAADGGGPVATAFVSEVLRHAQSEYLYRRVTSEIEIGGYRIPAGWWLRVGVWESHHEPPEFVAPAAASARFGPGAVSVDHAPFGIDRHACSGATLSMRSAAALASAIAADSDLEVTPAVGVVRGFRHWSHWRPDDSLALRPVR